MHGPYPPSHILNPMLPQVRLLEAPQPESPHTLDGSLSGSVPPSPLHQTPSPPLTPQPRRGGSLGCHGHECWLCCVARDILDRRPLERTPRENRPALDSSGSLQSLKAKLFSNCPGKGSEVPGAAMGIPLFPVWEPDHSLLPTISPSPELRTLAAMLAQGLWEMLVVKLAFWSPRKWPPHSLDLCMDWSCGGWVTNTNPGSRQEEDIKLHICSKREREYKELQETP